MRKIQCSCCGCARKTMVKAKVRSDSDGIVTEYSYTWLCFSCFFSAVTKKNLRDINKDLHKEFMQIYD